MQAHAPNNPGPPGTDELGELSISKSEEPPGRGWRGTLGGRGGGGGLRRQEHRFWPSFPP